MMHAAFFVSDELHVRTVKLPDGSEHQLHFKQLPAADFRRHYAAMQSEREEVRANGVAGLIAASVCTPDGKPAMTVKDALRLKVKAEQALAAAVLSVNDMDTPPGEAGEQGNDLPAEGPNGSGTS
jgi:hypothetical protein